MIHRVGFMQGRLTPMVDGRIQAFPWDRWRDEFPLARQHGFPLMEWTLDHDRLDANPLLAEAGRAEIEALGARHGVAIPSVTGDCFMQAPFWKAAGEARQAREGELRRVLEACGLLRVRIVVVPLVDGGSLASGGEEDVLVEVLGGLGGDLRRAGIVVAFESDYPPAELARLMDRFDRAAFGVNYDIGNSASLGFDPGEEIARYGERIVNVHVKDRRRHGTTVPLGEGDADLAGAIAALERAGYADNYVLQTARAEPGQDAEVLVRYRDATVDWLRRHAA